MNVLLWQLGTQTAIHTYRDAYVIYNPNAGNLRRHPGRLKEAESALRSAGHGVTMSPTKAAGHATELAREFTAKGADLVLAAGGDGTINEVLNGLAGSRTALGVLPLGTANVLAMETGMSRDVAAAARAVSNLEPVRIAAGRLSAPDGARPRFFLMMAGAGLDAHIVATLDMNLKKKLGKVAYWIAGFSSLARRLEELDVVTTEGRQRCSFALASRVRNYGGDLEIALGASLLSDTLELMVFEGANPFRYLKYFTGVLLRRAGRLRGVRVMQTAGFELQPVNDAPVYIQLDGEACGTLPARVELVRDAVTLLLPPDYLAKERRRWTT